MLAALTITTLLRLLLHASPINGAVMPDLSTLASSNSSLGFSRMDPDRCNSFPDWIGNGIVDSDCRHAINELFRDDVEPRKGQRYEFLRRGVGRVSPYPWVTTPRKHWYGTCTVVIAMLNQFVPGTLPGEPSTLPTLQTDTATFDQLHVVAHEIFSQCVLQKEPLEMESQAGWSYAGTSNSIGVFILRDHGQLDNLLVRDQLTASLNINGSSSIPLIALP